MTTTHRSVFCFGIVAVAFAACDGSKLDPGTGRGGDAGSGSGGTTGASGTTGTGTAGTGGCPVGRVSPPSAVPTEHRAAAKTCTPSNAPPIDGGALSCTSDADCTPDGGLPFGYNTCLHGVCSFDQCLTDADCGATGVCACSSDYYGGNAAYHANICVSGNCRVDADCGAGGYCSPSRGHCGTFEGFYCHGSTDTCVDSTVDCAGCNVANACVYAPTAGAFVCGSAVCNG